jgi:hypothetical protein
MFRRSLLFVLLAALGGCASAVPKVDESAVAKLRTDNNGIVLLHTSLNHVPRVGVTVARREENNRYVMWRGALPIKFPHDPPTLPGQIEMPAGEYGIVEIHAFEGANLREYHYVAPSTTEIDGLAKRTVYERPLARFSVGPGEVVDIGKIEIVDRPRERSLLSTNVSFTVRARPMPDEVLKVLAQRNPSVAKVRVTRTMIADSREW